MKTISVCMIVRNEEDNLPDCLESVVPIANEIIIVDTGSTDLTKAIAKRYGAKLIESTWENDFSYSRNIAIDAATCDLILSIDADERLLNPYELKQLALNNDNSVAGWLVSVKSVKNFDNGESQQFFAHLLRLFRNHPEIRYEGIVHEQVLNSIKRLGMNIANSKVQFLHLGYDGSPEQMARKHQRNLELLTTAISNHPNDAYSLTQRAKTLNALGKNEPAHVDFVRSLEIMNPDNQMRTRSLNYGAINAYQMGKYDIAEEWARESLHLIPEQAFAHFILAEIYFNHKNYHLALDHYQQMAHFQSGYQSLASLVSGDLAIPSDHIDYKIGRCHFLLGDYPKAGDFYTKSFATNNQNVLGLIGLANIAFNLKKYNEAKELLLTSQKIDNSKTEVNRYLEQIEIAMGGISQTEGNTTTTSAKLTVCMIVKNEADSLADCLRSVEDVADDIIIVDTGSTDDTIEVAKRFKTKIVQYRWNNDFSAARNESLKYATGDWILYIDADERLDAQSRKYIKNYINNALPEIGGLICTIESEHSNMDGSSELHRGGYPRLFRNLGYPKVKFIGRVHEQIAPSIVDAGFNFAVSDLKIIHLGYNQSREVMEQKIKRNYALLLEHVNEEPLNGYAWFQLGQTLGQMGLVKEAEDAIKFAINCGNLSDTIYSSSATALAQFAGNRRDFKESLRWAEASLEKAPNQIFTLTLKGYALLHLGQKVEAREALQLALNLSRSGVTTMTTQSSGFDVVINENIILKGLEAAEK